MNITKTTSTCTCNSCKKLLDIEMFPWRDGKHSSRRKQCNICYKESKSKYKNTNKETIREKRRKYYLENREETLETNRKWYLDNRENYLKARRENYDPSSRSDYWKEYSSKNSDKIKEYKRNRYIQKMKELYGEEYIGVRYRGEKIIEDLLIENTINFIKSYQIKEYIGVRKYLLVDFYLPEFNVIIEYNGRQHYEPVNFGNMSKEESIVKLKEQIERDDWLRHYCKNNNISLIEVDSRDINNADKIKTYLQDKLLPLLTSQTPPAYDPAQTTPVR